MDKLIEKAMLTLCPKIYQRGIYTAYNTEVEVFKAGKKVQLEHDEAQLLKAIPIIRADVAEEIFREIDFFIKQRTFGGIIRSHHFRVEEWDEFLMSLKSRYTKGEKKEEL